MADAISPSPLSDQSQPRLEGWKAISDFLNVAERTARNWERDKRLPVHRFSDNDKSRVWAFQHELQAWLAKRDTQPEMQALRGVSDGESTLQYVPRVPTRRVVALETAPLPVGPAALSEQPQTIENKRRLAVGLGGVFVAVLLFWNLHAGLLQSWPQRLNPHHLKIEGQTLVALSPEEKEVWRFLLPTAVPPLDRPGSSPWAVADINGDGLNEVLYSVQKPHENSSLLCIGPTGKLLWARQSGTPWATVGGKDPARKEFKVNLLGVLKYNRPDGGRIVEGSHSQGGFGMEVAVLRASDGAMVARYLHGGWFDTMALADLDGDGDEEVILGGVNESFTHYDEKQNRWNDPENGAYGSTIVILSRLFKASQGRTRHANDLWTYDVLPQGGERAVLLFKNPVRPMLGAKFFVKSLSVVDGQIDADVGNGIGGMVHYVLSPTLAFISANPAPLASEEGFGELVNPPRELSRRFEALQKLYADSIRRLGPDEGVWKH
jgi:hypothetical protein